LHADVHYGKGWYKDADIVMSIDNPARDVAWMNDAGDVGEVGDEDGHGSGIISPPEAAKLIVSKYRGNRTGFARVMFHPTSTSFTGWDDRYGDWGVLYDEHEKRRKGMKKRGRDQ
jgi:hypothetical protein